MLTNAPIHPTIPVVDLERARKFYEGTLGLKVARTDPSPGIVFQAGEGTSVYVYQRGATKAEHTAAAFHADDVSAAVRELKAKGVAFEEVEIPGASAVDSVVTMGDLKAAWFKDTEGNILGITNM